MFSKKVFFGTSKCKTFRNVLKIERFWNIRNLFGFEMFINDKLKNRSMAGSIMHDVLDFLDVIGMFDVILPFLLIYVIVFALLERTAILGYDKIDKDTKIPKKNLNAIFAFASAFFAILSEKVVSAMNSAIGPIMLVLLIIVLFMLLISSFRSKDGIEELGKGQKKAVVAIILVVIILISLNSIKTDDGDTWLESGWDYVSDHTNTGFVGAVLLLLGMGGFMIWIGSDKKPEKKDEDDD